MPTRGISGIALLTASGGAFLVYVGIKGSDPLTELRSILKGERPASLSDLTKAAGLARPSAQFDSPQGPVAVNSGLLRSAQKYLGKPYVWGSTFSNGGGGDCSGLVWRAMLDMGVKLPRFTTTTILLSSHFVKVSAPAQGDVVVWPGDHMGIVWSPEQKTMLAAPSTGKVVQYSSYAHRRTPIYLRVK